MYNDDIDCDCNGPQETDDCLPREMIDAQWYEQEAEAWDALLEEVDGFIELLEEWEAAYPQCDDCPAAGCDNCPKKCDDCPDQGCDDCPESDA